MGTVSDKTISYCYSQPSKATSARCQSRDIARWLYTCKAARADVDVYCLTARTSDDDSQVALPQLTRQVCFWFMISVFEIQISPLC